MSFKANKRRAARLVSTIAALVIVLSLTACAAPPATPAPAEEEAPPAEEPTVEAAEPAEEAEAEEAEVAEPVEEERDPFGLYIEDFEAANIDWRQFEGETIHLTACNIAALGVQKEAIPLFEELPIRLQGFQGQRPLIAHVAGGGEKDAYFQWGCLRCHPSSRRFDGFVMVIVGRPDTL